MGFNYGLEKKNFDRQWAIIRKQYEDAGMSIPYIHIFILHNRRLYERERPYHLRASDLRGNGTDPGNDPVHPHALRCLPLQFCRIQGVQKRHCSQRRPEHGHLHSLPDPARSSGIFRCR